MTTQLDALKTMTTVVADSGDFSSFSTLKPQDATTNPSLLFTAAQTDQYQNFVKIAVDYAKEKKSNPDEQIKLAMDKLAVTVGAEILKIIPGRVSTELDARLSYDTEATILKARVIRDLYKEIGVDVEKRVLFKIASTWEGIKAAERLEKEGIHCNLTLLFSFAQAVACAEAKVTLISPFVGRILDFWKKEKGVANIPVEEDPGVTSVTKIYNYYKKFGYQTIVMGASFRSKEEVLALAGCDYLTIAPNFLKALHDSKDSFPKKLDAEIAKKSDLEKIHLDEKAFRWLHGTDPCGTAKLAEGIVKFAEDTEKLEALLKKKIEAS